MYSASNERISSILNNLNLFSDDLRGLEYLKLKLIDMGVSGVFQTSKEFNGTGADVVRMSYEISGKSKAFDDTTFNPYMNVPKHWDWATTEELCFTQTGTTPDKSSVPAGTESITYITSGDLKEFVAHSTTKVIRFPKSKLIRVAPAGSVLFVGIGNIGKCGITAEDVTFNQQLHSATPYVMNPKYMCYFYSSTYFRNQFSTISSATTLTILNKSKWSGIYIPVPTLDEQERIVHQIEKLLAICSQVGEAIKLRTTLGLAARKSVVNALSIAQTSEEVQRAWERIQNSWNVIASTPDSIDSLRELILDVLFKPKEEDFWPVRPFGDLLTISNGDRSKNYPSKEHRVSSGIPFVNAGHLKDGLIDLSDMDYISREKYESLSGGKFKDGDVLFCLRGSLGKSALVRNIGEGTVASSMAIFRVSAQIDSEYLFWFLQSGMAKIQIKKFDNGTAQPNLAAKSVLRFQIPLPNLSEQVAIVSKVKDLMRICNQLEQSMNQKEHIAHNFARLVISFSA